MDNIIKIINAVMNKFKKSFITILYIPFAIISFIVGTIVILTIFGLHKLGLL